MSAQPALPSSGPGVADLVPTARTSAPADSVEIFPLDSEEMRSVARAGGAIYDSWMRYWQTLEPSERDPLSHPACVAGHLEGHLRSKTASTTKVLVTFGGGEALSLLPVVTARRAALAHARGFNSMSWALARSDHGATLDALFATRFRCGHVDSLYLESVEATNDLLEVDWPHVHRPRHFRSLIALRDGYGAVLARMSANGRKSVRRLLKRISRDHEIDLETITEPERLDHGFERYLQVEDRSWKQQHGRALRERPRECESLRWSLNHLARDRRTVFQFLRAGDTDIAAQLCAVIDRQLLVLKTSFDTDWANYGAGKLLLAESMRTWCPDRDIDAVNLVSGLDWHLQWAPRLLDSHTLWMFASGVRGQLARLRDVPPQENAKILLHDLGLERPARWLQRLGHRGRQN